MLLAVLWGVCCCKQRRAGRRERAVEDANWDKGAAELVEYRKQMAAGRFAQSGGGGGGGMPASPPRVMSKF